MRREVRPADKIYGGDLSGLLWISRAHDYDNGHFIRIPRRWRNHARRAGIFFPVARSNRNPLRDDRRVHESCSPRFRNP